MEPEDNNNLEIPSSLSTVNVRTMRSDVESIRETGGTHPLPEVVNTAPVFSNAEPEPLETKKGEQVSVPGHYGWIWWVLGFVILFLAGYFVLPMFL